MKYSARKFGPDTRSTSPPILLLHGLLGQGRNLAGLARALGDTRFVMSCDLRNHGGADWDDRHDYPALAGDLAESFGALAPFDLVGHSMGGKLAMMLALMRPELVRHLIVIDIAPRPYAHDHSELIDHMLAIDPAQFESKKQIGDALAKHIDDAPMRAFLLSGLKSGPPMRWQNNLLALRANMANITGWPDITGQFAGKALFIRGRNSDYVLDEDRGNIKRYFPRARLATIERAGHWVHADQPQILARICKEFLNAPLP